ncbi:hypothetical protein NSMS1_58330 [Nostoc sp. MS1]|nr:hypothetical protein NSMS1_58330 [Nostoc sp. MS1]
MITPEKIKTFICLNFVIWLMFTSFYSYVILGWQHQSLTNISFSTDTQQTKLFQRERGGVRRIASNSGRNITKQTWSKSV